MFKLFYQGTKPGKNTGTTNRNEKETREQHRTPGKQRDLILTNILEEGSSVDEPRSFEQDEQYLNECLQVLNGTSEDQVVDNENLEEYDFDDYNSVASTASLLNIHAELEEKKHPGKDSFQIPTSTHAFIRPFQKKDSLKGGTGAVVYESIESIPSKSEQNTERSRLQVSISKVNTWDKLGTSLGSLDVEWDKIFLEVAKTGTLNQLQDVYNKLGGRGEVVVRVTDSSANTALHKAAEAGNLPCLRWLVEQLPTDCLSNITNSDNLSPLAITIKHGHTKCLEWLLEETSAASEIRNDASRLELMFLVVQHGQDECLRYLLTYIRTKGIEMDIAYPNGVTLGHVAAREGHMTCLQTLVDHNIDVTVETEDGCTPADYAYASGQTSCARFLVMVESCWLLSVRVTKLHSELKESKAENAELKRKIEVLETQLRSGLPDRPEAVGGDQSDTNSTGTTRLSDSRVGSGITESPRYERGRSNSTPDGESPKGLAHERNVSAYQYHVNGTSENRPLNTSNGASVVNPDAEVRSVRQFEALKHGVRLGARGSIDSTGSGSSTPMSWTDMAADRSGEIQHVMAKQIAAVTRRLVMSKHSQKVEESPLIRSNLLSVRNEISPRNQQLRKQNTSPLSHQSEPCYSSSSSRSHSPSRTDSTSSSRPASGNANESLDPASNSRTGVTEAKGVPSSRLRALANRRKAATLSSDSSDSDIEHGEGQRVARHRRYYTSSTRTQEHAINSSGYRRGLHRNVPSDMHRTKKTVSWNETCRGAMETTVNNQSVNDKVPSQRVPFQLSPQATRTESRENIGSGLGNEKRKPFQNSVNRSVSPQLPPQAARSRVHTGSGLANQRRKPIQNSINRSVQGRLVPTVVVHQVARPTVEDAIGDRHAQSYSFEEYQLDERPWYETEEFD